MDDLVVRIFSRGLRLGAAAAAAVGALALGPAGAGAAGPIESLPGGWSHAEVNVVIRGNPHTLIFDRGRVLAVGASSLTVREKDGTVLTISVAPRAVVRLDRRPSTLGQIQPRDDVVTERIDGGPAVLVRASSPPARLGKTLRSVGSAR